MLKCFQQPNTNKSYHFRTENFHRNQRFFTFISFHLIYLTSCLNSFDNSTENGMLIIKPRASNNCDKELRSICAWTSVCHGQNIRTVESVLFRSELVLKSSSPNRLSTSSVTFRTSTLVHETFDDSMKNNSIVITFFNEFYEVLACFRAIFKI